MNAKQDQPSQDRRLRREFSQLTRFGFSSSGKPGVVFHVDNIRFETVGN